MEKERLQKYIASCGVCSRRKAEELILEKRVKVNGIIVEELGVKIDENVDCVTIDGKEIVKCDKKIYIKLHKPEGYITTSKDQFGRKTVLDLIDIDDRVYPIGRLDYDTSGLLILTNDGDLANKLMHPKYHIYKTYVAKIDGVINVNALEKLKTGVFIEDYKTSPAKVRLINSINNSSEVEISIYEGKNRQVRKMFEAVGHNVSKLKRVSFGKINLKGLSLGQWAYLAEEEIQFLKNQNK